MRLDTMHPITSYAITMESYEQIPMGTLVALEGDRIRTAHSGDMAIGVVTEAPTFVVGHGPRVEVDEWGRPVGAPLPQEEVRYPHAVAILGLIHCRITDTVVQGENIVPDDSGRGMTACGDGWPVLRVISPYDERGYGIAQVLIR